MQTAVPRGYRPRVGTERPDPATVFDLLGNERCRAILAAVGDEAMTAPEIADAAAIPISTVYRHVESLTDAGLLAESIRIDPRGRNRNEYTRPVSSLSVVLGGDFDVSLD